MARRLEQRTYYPEVDLYDEWQPFDFDYVAGRTINTWGWNDSDFRSFVREWNREAKLRGDNTRLRSVEDEGDFF